MGPPPTVEILVNLPVEGRFHYAVPEHLQGALLPGHRVLVPFGPRRVTGFVVEVDAPLPEGFDPARLRAVEARLDPDPLVPVELLDLARFAADYYLAPAGEVLKAALPPGFTGASKLRYVATKEGRRALQAEETDLSAPARELLELSSRANGLSRKDGQGKLGRSLERAGLITPKDQLSARDGGGEQELLVRKLPVVLAEPFLQGAKRRRELYDLLADGPVAVERLRERMGATAFRSAARSLLDAGVLSSRIEATSSEGETAAVQAEALADAPRLTLTDAQQEALDILLEGLEQSPAPGFLLRGVTGSGKTEVYLGLIEAALKQGRGALVLVPEIALTPQLESRFRARFGDQVVVLHSGVPDAERRRRWRALREGRARIALGPRSAVWAPIRDLGAVVVDEEHDGSFKQHTDVRYNGRDLALVRARRAGAVAVLGSATPSLEASHLVDQGKLEEIQLPSRVGNRPMPEVLLVDLSEERRAMKGEVRLLSRALEDALREMKHRGEQGIVFLNRRGFNTIVHCGSCDDVKKCPHCDVSLTFHRADRKVACHYCGFEEPLDARCRSCGSQDVRPLGAGTERIAAALTELVPDLRVLRLDRDVTQRAGGLVQTLDAFRDGEADVLVGTQMVAKGHDFPKVTVVGIVLADASLAFPDFRAAERTFQLLTQVAGRAGRAERPGRVIVQTLQPDHYVLKAALAHDVESFAETELGLRAELHYPPFSRLGVIRSESGSSERALAAVERAAELAREVGKLRILGPSPAPIGKIRNRHRFMLLLFAPSPAALVRGMSVVRRRLLAEGRPGVDLLFDVDASDLL